MESLARLSGATHSMRCRAALVAAGTVLFVVGGTPSGLANEPPPTASATHGDAVTAVDSLKIFNVFTASHSTSNSWTIRAKPDDARVELPRGELAAVDHIVEVRHTGRTMSRFEFSGTISVTNPATSARAITVSNTLPGTTCHVADAVGRSIAPNTRMDFTFSCVPDAGFLPGVNDTTTASVSWTDDDGVRTMEAVDDVGWDGLYLHNTVDIHDINDNEISVLGSLMVEPDGALTLLTPESGTVDGAVAHFTYRAQLEGIPNACKTYATMGVVAGDRGEHVASDPASVIVCPPSTAPGLPHTGN